MSFASQYLLFLDLRALPDNGQLGKDL